MRTYGYLVVEGPHDIEFAYRLLAPYGLERVRLEAELDPFFQPLVPTTFPHNGDLQARVPVPLFMQSNSHAIALHSALGDTRLAQTIEESAFSIDYSQLAGIGIILDTDKEVAVTTRYAGLKEEFARNSFNLPAIPGTISADEQRVGVFVLPDNQSEGNLEDLLLQCAESTFPKLLESARKHVDFARDDTSFVDKKREDLSKSAKYNKAVVGSIANTLRPGRAVQASIQDNVWLRGNNLSLPRIKAVQTFLVDLFGLALPTAPTQ
ncbi:hypothetical protein CA51_16920 [Rosistilla oblonga]|uniref:DUF3226 domain-containing protein n=1 Tax=Rosistilla oblonga TaxID=2527990 RepID=UPI0011887573|nr:DUF3226 domain-containing protein [Rosistilla oblonga]QDV11816.1 hypothetical protein CA51_16920 [Rosistilla oblonga]